jgi:hypothetical protein
MLSTFAKDQSLVVDSANLVRWQISGDGAVRSVQTPPRPNELSYWQTTEISPAFQPTSHGDWHRFRSIAPRDKPIGCVRATLPKKIKWALVPRRGTVREAVAAASAQSKKL